MHWHFTRVFQRPWPESRRLDNSLSNQEHITGLILAGGRGSRMGHVDKGLQPFRGQTMAQHVLARLEPQVSTVAINANQHLDTYASFGAPVWPDDLEGFAGPLAGLETGLRRCATPLLASVPCDSPFVPLDLVARLQQALHAVGADLALAETEEDGRLQPQPGSHSQKPRMSTQSSYMRRPASACCRAQRSSTRSAGLPAACSAAACSCVSL